jgi:glucan phosphoethanolaminetransferase (alkaline phosphatase superfamily)
MTLERYLRAIAGFFILVSVLLAYFHSIYWLWFTGFVGLNLLQSAFTNWCPMMTIFKKLGVKSQA